MEIKRVLRFLSDNDMAEISQDFREFGGVLYLASHLNHPRLGNATHSLATP